MIYDNNLLQNNTVNNKHFCLYFLPCQLNIQFILKQYEGMWAKCTIPTVQLIIRHVLEKKKSVIYLYQSVCFNMSCVIK